MLLSLGGPNIRTTKLENEITTKIWGCVRMPKRECRNVKNESSEISHFNKLNNVLLAVVLQLLLT